MVDLTLPKVQIHRNRYRFGPAAIDQPGDGRYGFADRLTADEPLAIAVTQPSPWFGFTLMGARDGMCGTVVSRIAPALTSTASTLPSTVR